MRDKRTYTFGVGFPLGPQYSLLCKWLKSAEIPYGIKVRIEPAAGPQMFPLLKMGYLDGYCVGEPWNSLAVLAGIGACVATSAQLAPYHPEKGLLVRKEFAEKAAWITGRLYELLRWEARPAALRNVFRRNAFLHAQAMVARTKQSKTLQPQRAALLS